MATQDSVRSGPRDVTHDTSQLNKTNTTDYDTSAAEDRAPVLWRHRFPQDIVDTLVSFKNPSRSIYNSELKLAGALGQNNVLTRLGNIAEQTTATSTDNIPCSWATKAAVSLSEPVAYLLQLLAIRQRMY